MNKYAYTIIFCLLANQNFAMTCTKTTIPQVIKHLENYTIVSSNTAAIPTNFAFGGEKLIYSVSAHPKNKKNIVKIDSHTGKIKIEANASDQFDVVVNAKNACGKISSKFNVEIDEEI